MDISHVDIDDALVIEDDDISDDEDDDHDDVCFLIFYWFFFFFFCQRSFTELLSNFLGFHYYTIITALKSFVCLFYVPFQSPVCGTKLFDL